MTSLLATVILAVVMVAIPIAPAHRHLVVNLTASMPRGLYLLSRDRSPREHEIVVVRLSPAANAIAVSRGYLAAHHPVLKRVAGVAGDRICRFGGAVSINGQPAAIARARDRTDRALPRWHGCLHLRPRQLFVLGAAAGSFDSRYFGVIDQSAIVGIAHPVWIIHP